MAAFIAYHVHDHVHTAIVQYSVLYIMHYLTICMLTTSLYAPCTASYCDYTRDFGSQARLQG